VGPCAGTMGWLGLGVCKLVGGVGLGEESDPCSRFSERAQRPNRVKSLGQRGQ